MDQVAYDNFESHHAFEFGDTVAIEYLEVVKYCRLARKRSTYKLP